MAVEKSATVELRLFEPGDATAFRRLNEAWIEKLFSLEEHDHDMLVDPVKHIIEPGGQIVVAADGKRVVGCCALIPMGPCTFEMVKLAVAEEYQGQGVGRRLLQRTIDEARTMGAKKLYLESNRRLTNVIHLNESLGFRHLPPKPSPYARVDVFMEMDL